MTLLTGDPFFPGGIGEFEAKKNQFLVFEEGPSVDITLQWATYRDASDQTSLSRIWGGIHPPADDIVGRIIGEKVGVDAFDHAVKYFNGITPLKIPYRLNGPYTIKAFCYGYEKMVTIYDFSFQMPLLFVDFFIFSLFN